MLAFVVAGESVFFLPFVIARVFRPTMLDVFQLSNLELGTAYSVYGIVAMIAYFFGGPLADRFPPGKLMSFALLATSAGGLVLLLLPGPSTLNWLYGYWGVTTILLFWSPLIRATREWADGEYPGRAFGILDGGRGLVAAAVGSIAVAVFAWALPIDVDSATDQERGLAFQRVILVFVGITFATSALVWFVVPTRTETVSPRDPARQGPDILRVASMPTVWLQALVILCAYSGYKGLDDISLYADEALGFDEVEAARLSAITLWMRPLAAVGAGFAADRWGVTRMSCLSFVILGMCTTGIAAGMLRPGMTVAIFVTFAATAAALFALRGLYFAMMEEGKVPLSSTGAAVGIVSVIGYTPDIFMGPIMGVLLDRSPGETGHHQVFGLVSVFAWIGLASATLFAWIANKPLANESKSGSV